MQKSENKGYIDNIRTVWKASTEWERMRGMVYYDHQRARLESVAKEHRLPIPAVIAAFCVLSPNNSEKVTYHALMDCIAVVLNQAPADTKISAFGNNTIKAKKLLEGGIVEEILSGPKVTAFYHNTLNPDDERYVTIDGHMINIITGKRIRLTETRKLGPSVYELYAECLREVAKGVGFPPAPRLQSILWLTWKRMHRILWTPQQSFFFMHPTGNSHE